MAAILLSSVKRNRRDNPTPLPCVCRQSSSLSVRFVCFTAQLLFNFLILFLLVLSLSCFFGGARIPN